MNWKFLVKWVIVSENNSFPKVIQGKIYSKEPKGKQREVNDTSLEDFVTDLLKFPMLYNLL